MERAQNTGYRYRICLEGHVGQDWIDWPHGSTVTQTYDQDGHRAVTLLTVVLPDLPALYGLLDKLRDLNLKLIYTQREEGKIGT